MNITLLSPTRNRLLRLRGEWEQIIEEMGLEPGSAGDVLAGHPAEGDIGVLGGVEVEDLAMVPFKKDTSKPNGSSIAFLAEHAGKTVLFTGDSFANDLEEAIKMYLESTGDSQLKIDAWKLAHHGGKKNTSPELIQLIDCPNFIVPTSGARYHHPNPETIARILKLKPEDRTIHFHFNYRSEENEVWDDDSMRDEWNYQTHYPNAGKVGNEVRLD